MIQDFWGKKDDVSMARSLRLATIQNVFNQGLITEQDARELLRDRLDHDDPSTFYDDSDCLVVFGA